MDHPAVTGVDADQWVRRRARSGPAGGGDAVALEELADIDRVMG
jgi:hypothetical protein